MIEVNLLRYAQAAAETGSFSQAASRFGIKQSTLSQGIKYLEARLGQALFHRSTRGVTLTGCGDRIIERVARIVDDIDRLVADAHDVAKGRTGTLRIGFNGSLLRGPVPTILRNFEALYPGVRIEAEEANRHELLAAIGRGTLDVAVAPRSAPPAGLNVLGLWTEPLRVALSSAHPLAARETLVWQDLSGSPMMVTRNDPGPDIERMIRLRLSALGVAPSITRHDVASANLPVLAMAKQVAVGVGLAPGPCRSRYVVRKVLDAFGPTMVEHCLYWSTDREEGATRNFIALADTSLEFLPEVAWDHRPVSEVRLARQRQ